MVVRMFTDEYAELVIPEWVTDIHAFRRWTDQDDFPESGRIWWLACEIWADFCREQIFSHVCLKGEFACIIGGLQEVERAGRYFIAGARLTNFSGGFSGIPDGIFISHQSITDGKVRLFKIKKVVTTKYKARPIFSSKS